MELPKYRIALGLTRPAVNKIGIPHNAWILILGGTAVFVVTVGHGHWQYWFSIAPFYIAVRGLTEWDHNWPRIVRQWAFTKFAVIFFGGGTLSPIAVGAPKTIDDVDGAV